MFTILVCHDGSRERGSIHVVAEDGKVAHSAPTVQRALRWLWDLDERQVVAMTDAGPELFLIEGCTGLTMTLPALSLRRAFHGVCADLPAFLGLGGDPTLRAPVTAHDNSRKARHRRLRQRTVDRATAPAIIGAANDP